MAIPFLDLKAGYLELKEELDETYRRVMASGYYIMGPELESFESEFAAYCGVSFCIGVGNGLEALYLSLRARGIREGDEVIVPAHTFIATWLAVSMTGAAPVPVACNEKTYNVDANLIEAALSSRTKAIIPVHLYGQPADMDPICDIAKKHGLFVLEDAAQSQGARYKKRLCGSLGDAAGTSFYPAKNLGCYGDGGAVLTNNAALAEKVRCLRNYGAKDKYHHIEAGHNSRLDELQAAFLRVRLRHLDAWNARRAHVAKKYHEAFANTDTIATFVPDWSSPAWHIYAVRIKNRDAVKDALTKRGIQTLIHYPVPPHAQECYKDLAVKGDFSGTVKMTRELLSLPMSPHMSEAQTAEVIDAVLHLTRR
jgi:dTDP-4-amino-4,6-dideoxygalactose transaminase